MAEEQGGLGEQTIADAQKLEQFAILSSEARLDHLNAALRGVLAETALTARVRFEWRLLQPLLHAVLDALMASYESDIAEDVGPPRPIPGVGSADALRERLHGLLDSYSAAPFTIQRLCEVLLEPRKQYQRLDKVGMALEKLLMVTSCVQPDPSPPPLPALSSLGSVNDNPASPYHDGRPPNIVHPQAAQQQTDGAQRSPEVDGAGNLPNGTYGPQPAPGGSDAFAFFLDAEIVASGQAAGPEAQPASHSTPMDAEVAQAEAFVEAALGNGAAGGSSGAGSQQAPTAAAHQANASSPPEELTQTLPESDGAAAASGECQYAGPPASDSGEGLGVGTGADERLMAMEMDQPASSAAAAAAAGAPQHTHVVDCSTTGTVGSSTTRGQANLLSSSSGQ